MVKNQIKIRQNLIYINQNKVVNLGGKNNGFQISSNFKNYTSCANKLQFCKNY